MIYVIVTLRTHEEIRECLLYTKHCASMVLDTQDRECRFSLPLRHKIPDFWCLEGETVHLFKQGLWSKKSKFLWPHRRLKDVIFLKDCLLPDVKNSVYFYQINTDIFQKQCIAKGKGYSHISPVEEKEWSICCIPSYQCTVLLNGHLASCILTVIIASQRFRRHFFLNLIRKGFEKVRLSANKPECDLEFQVHFVIDIVAVWPQQGIDFAWSWYLNHLLTKRMQLEEAMAWLSTLGGAHSSLGEYFSHHAEIAGHISLKQLKLAVSLGDPFTIARCHMFWAFSLLQQGYTAKAKVIVRRIYRFATSHSVCDIRLINMCLSAWARLQHLHRRQIHKKKTLEVDRRQVFTWSSQLLSKFEQPHRSKLFFVHQTFQTRERHGLPKEDTASYTKCSSCSKKLADS